MKDTTPTVSWENDLVVKNFHCSEHGYLRPKPKCPKCSDDIRTQLDLARQQGREDAVEYIKTNAQALQEPYIAENGFPLTNEISYSVSHRALEQARHAGEGTGIKAEDANDGRTS